MFSKVLAIATFVATVLADNLPASQCNVGYAFHNLHSNLILNI
jgi:hypothetical protein